MSFVSIGSAVRNLLADLGYIPEHERTPGKQSPDTDTASSQAVARRRSSLASVPATGINSNTAPPAYQKGAEPPSALQEQLPPDATAEGGDIHPEFGDFLKRHYAEHEMKRRADIARRSDFDLET